ncbi:MAG: methyltransferase domain-containing protein [Archaeoglobaceae archaeon]
MKYVFFLSGENLELAQDEITHLFQNSSILGVDGQIAIVDIGGRNSGSSVVEAEGKFDRLALTHEVWRSIGTCDIEELENVFEELEMPSKKLCVRVLRSVHAQIDSALMERILGEVLWERGAKISVSDPEVIIKVYVSSRAYVGILVHSRDKKQFLERQPDLKPYFRPGVIIPKFARTLVNISEVERGEVLLDPMCGAGTILTEAGLMGVNFMGVEAYADIVEGCAVNLKHYGLPVNVLRGDVKALPFKDETFHTIITDFPYMKSSRSFGSIDTLYRQSLEEFRRVLLSGRKAVIISNKDVDDLLLNHFSIEKKFYQRVHGSLIRRFYLLH